MKVEKFANATDLKFEVHQRNVHILKVPVGVDISDVFKPQYLIHCADRLKALDKLCVYVEDYSAYAEALVVQVLAGGVILRPIVGPITLETVEIDFIPIPGYTVKWQGPGLKHCVIRDHDGARLHEGSNSKAEAQSWVMRNRAQLPPLVDPRKADSDGGADDGEAGEAPKLSVGKGKQKADAAA